MQLKGFRMWEQDVNKRGGILGRPVEVVILDDQSDALKAEQLYDDLIHRDKMDFLFAPFSSKITLQVLPLTESHKYPMLISGASSDRLWEQGYQYVFGLFLPASRIATGFLELLVTNDINDIAIVYSVDPFSKSLGEGTRKWAGILGLNVSLFEAIPGDSGTDLKRTVTNVVNSGARALVLCEFVNEFVGLREALARDGRYQGLYYTPVGPGLPEFYARLKEKANGVFSTSQWIVQAEGTRSGSNEFVQAFVQAYNKKPSYFAATAYASGQLLEQAIIEEGSIDRDAVRSALSRIYATSVIGPYSVDTKGVQVKNFSFTVQVQDGVQEVVWPEAFVTKPPVFK
jgi:branched-chain amino acid transport system substrate-binding protein